MSLRWAVCDRFKPAAPQLPVALIDSLADSAGVAVSPCLLLHAKGYFLPPKQLNQQCMLPALPQVTLTSGEADSGSSAGAPGDAASSGAGIGRRRSRGPLVLYQPPRRE